MKSTWLLIVGVLIGLYFYQVEEQDRTPIAVPAAEAPEATQVPQIPLPRPSRFLSAIPVDLGAPRAEIAQPERPAPQAQPQQQAAPAKKTATAITRRLPPLPAARPDGFLDQAELEMSAALTQNRAITELERLDRLLDLSREQADQIFPILARHAAAYDPSLRIRIGRSETSSPTPLPPADGRVPRRTPQRDPEAKPDDPDTDDEPEIEDELEGILTPPQNQTLVTDEIESDEWWTEILDELTNNADSL